MDSDLLIPLFWTITFASLIVLGLRKLKKKSPREKKWVRPSSQDREGDK